MRSAAAVKLQQPARRGRKPVRGLRTARESNAAVIRNVCEEILRRNKGRMTYGALLAELKEAYDRSFVNRLYWIQEMVFDPMERFDMFCEDGHRYVRLRG